VSLKADILLYEEKTLHFNDFFRIAQLGLLNMKPFTNFGSSTHYIYGKDVVC